MVNVRHLQELIDMAPERAWEHLADYTERGQAAQSLCVAAVKALPELLADRIASEEFNTTRAKEMAEQIEALEDKVAVDAEYIKITSEQAEESRRALIADTVKVTRMLLEATKLLEVYGNYHKTPHPVLVECRAELTARGYVGC